MAFKVCKTTPMQVSIIKPDMPQIWVLPGQPEIKSNGSHGLVASDSSFPKMDKVWKMMEKEQSAMIGDQWQGGPTLLISSAN